MMPRYGSKPGEKIVVQQVLFMRERRASYRQIGWELLKAGIEPRSGGQWHPNQLRRIALRAGFF